MHVIFQPHRYSRTQLLMEEFATAFENADALVLLDIYPASEPPLPGVTSQALADRISQTSTCDVQNAASFDAAVQLACAGARPGDMILTLGAGNVSQLGRLVLEYLTRQESSKSAVAG